MSEERKPNTALKIVIVITAGIIILLLLINGVAGYLLYKENKEKEDLKNQIYQIDSLKRSK